MSIRKARPSDAQEITELRKNSFEKVNQLSPQLQIALRNKNTPERIIEKMKNREMFCMISPDGKIMGTVDLTGNEIGGVFVRHDLINQGIGTQLMNFIEEYAKNKGIKKVKLFSAEKSKGFYLKLGYQIIGERVKNEGNVKNLNFEMEKQL
jgi:putative acetyltransferase